MPRRYAPSSRERQKLRPAARPPLAYTAGTFGMQTLASVGNYCSCIPANHIAKGLYQLFVGDAIASCPQFSPACARRGADGETGGDCPYISAAAERRAGYAIAIAIPLSVPADGKLIHRFFARCHAAAGFFNAAEGQRAGRRRGGSGLPPAFAGAAAGGKQRHRQK